MPRLLFLGVSLAVTVVLAACSAAGVGPDRSVAVTMSDDMRYRPAVFEFLAGQTVRFEVTNAGRTRHEFFIGDIGAHEDHAAEMRDMADNPMAHEEPTLLILDAGQSGTLDYTFARAGALLIGCHEPGHYQAGMVANVSVHPVP